MTTELTQPESIDDYTHPHWCDLTACRVERGSATHQHAGTALPMLGNRVTTTLRRVNAGQIEGMPTSVHVEIRETDWTDNRALGCSMTPDEARLLAQVLITYAGMCETRFRGIPSEMTAAEIREEQDR